MFRHHDLISFEQLLEKGWKGYVCVCVHMGTHVFVHVYVKFQRKGMSHVASLGALKAYRVFIRKPDILFNGSSEATGGFKWGHCMGSKTKVSFLSRGLGDSILWS